MTRKPENRDRAYIVKLLRPRGAFPIENNAKAGCPDIAYVNGLIEMKREPVWPKRRSTPLSVRHFTPNQRRFQEWWWELGGCISLILHVENEWLLFDGPIASRYVGVLARPFLYEAARHVWLSKPDRASLFKNLDAMGRKVRADHAARSA